MGHSKLGTQGSGLSRGQVVVSTVCFRSFKIKFDPEVAEDNREPLTNDAL